MRPSLAEIGQRAVDRVPCIGGGTHWNRQPRALRWLQADLHPGAEHLLDLLGTQGGVAPGFQKTPGEVFRGTHAGGKGLPKEAAALDELGDGVDQRQPQVAHLGRYRIMRVDVFQCVAPVLLYVEALIRDFPSQTPPSLANSVTLWSSTLKLVIHWKRVTCSPWAAGLVSRQRMTETVWG